MDPSDLSVVPDLDRRFGGVARLYGALGAARIRASSVCVIGMGGVGSWAVEALARSGVSRLSLIDLDHVAESNVNRQLHALGDEFGKAKVQAMGERVLAIHPACELRLIEEFIDESNLDALLGSGFDAIIDAIDNVRAKAALAAWCRARKQHLVTCGGAGGRIDPTRIAVEDLARTTGDALLSKVRARLRQEYRFTREPKRKFGIEAVFSDEPVRLPEPGEAACEVPTPASALQGLNCAGYGSSVCVTAGFGMTAAARVLRRIAATPL